jgi:SIR2-like domain
MKLLLFTGAGTSAELGVPAMRVMAEQFIDHLHDIDVEQSIVDKIERLIVSAGNDMEHAIDVIDKIEGGLLARRELGETVDDTEMLPYRRLREEAEWFVQHSCEQIAVPSALRMWSPVLQAAEGLGLTIASTNYDRGIEIAAARLRISVDDGFDAFAGQEIATWRGFSPHDGIRLLKLHGSTDWYHGADFKVFKLRHPMPLYGPLELVSKGEANLPLHSALVLPSREKTVTLPPFPVLGAEFRNRAAEADVAVFLGTSLRDPHIRDVCLSCTNQRPTFIVSHSGVFSEGVVPPGARIIKQSSGQFLISSLPQCMRARDVEVLARLSTNLGVAIPNALEWLVMARTESAPTSDRCAAIEGLADTRIALPKDEVEALLRSPNATVKLYALGLVQASPDRAALLAAASAIAEDHQVNAEFKAELNLLQEMATTQ